MIKCPACNTDIYCNRLGDLKYIEGVIKLHTPGSLYECSNCGLLFRHPYITEEEIKKQYEELPDNIWMALSSKRNDFIYVHNVITKYIDNGSILDIGCYRGDFLLSLPERYVKYGIEPNYAAAKIAINNGINIQGSTLKDLYYSNQKYDCIVAIDVIEHMQKPFEFLIQIKKLLKIDGFIILSTADSNYWLWKRHRLDYWYYFTEHVSFISRKWLKWATARLDLKILYHHNFMYDSCNYMDYFLWQLIYISLELNKSSDHNIVSKTILSRIMNRSIYNPISLRKSKDHFITVIKYSND